MNGAVGYASRPFYQLPPSGDGWLMLKLGAIHRLMLVDGIGHGQHAHSIVRCLIQQLTWICQRSSRLIGLADCLHALHALLRQQGSDAQAAVALLDVNSDLGSLRGLSIGTVQVHVQTGETSHCFPSLCGMLGGRLPSQLLESSCRIDASSLVAVFSDGVESQGAREYLKALATRHSHQHLEMQSEADLIVRRFGRISDDASCALLRPGQLSP